MELKTTLFKHQRAAVDKLKKIKVGALYMEMGTGKTRVALGLIKNRLEKNKIDHVIWLCPCSVKTNLKNDIEKHCSGLGERLTIMGIETLSSSMKANFSLLDLIEKKDCYLVVDESNLVKNMFAKRTKNIIRIAEKCKYKLILNGTPISKNEKDLFSQWYILSWKILGYKSFWSFARNHLEYDEKIPGRIVNTLNVDYLVKKIEPYTFQVKKSECLTLPKQTFESEYYDMTTLQWEEYNRVAEMLMMDLDEFKPSTIYRLLTGVQNVISGMHVSERKGKLISKKMFDNEYDNPRINKLLDIINQIGDEKVIIFCKYTHEIKSILEVLGNRAVGFYGEVKQKERQNNLENFRCNKQFLVANKSCAGYGLNLQFCSYVIYYSNDWDYATRVQSEDRVHRIGQINNVCYIDIIASDTLDLRIKSCLDRKSSLVEEFKKEISEQQGENNGDNKWRKDILKAKCV